MEEQKIPKVAVVICNKNYGHFIKDAIQSAALQDYPNKVIYVVDDASTDDSIKVFHKTIFGQDFVSPILEENDQYILSHAYFNETNLKFYLFQLKTSGGPSRARNFAIKHAIKNGVNLIAILDADDVWKQGKLSESVLKFIEDPQIAGVYTDYLHLNTESGAITYESKWAYDVNKLRQECIVHSGAVLNAEWLKQTGLYDETLRVTEDYSLFRRLAQRAIFIQIPKDLVIVRVQPKNSTQTVPKEIWEENYRRTMSIPL